MRLPDLFTREKTIADAGKAPQNMGHHGAVRGDTANHQLHALTPGQTVQGEIVSKNGNEVQIRLFDDVVLQARVEQNINLEVGRMMTFEVKSSGQMLTLGPLFTNMATDPNVLKALNMASLPINQTTAAMTKQLMEEGMPIDRNTLQQVYRETNLFPQAQIADIVNLHKLQIPVNEQNVTQMTSYRNLSYQLVTGLNNVLDTLPNVFTHLMENGDTQGAAKLYGELLKLVQEAFVDENTTAGEGTEQPAAETIAKQLLSEEYTVSEKMLAQTVIKESISVLKTLSDAGNLSEGGKAGPVQDDSKVLPSEQDAITGGLSGQAGVEGMQTEETLGSDAATAIETMSEKEQMQDIGKLIQSLIVGFPKDAEGQKALLKPLLTFFEQQWTITPEDVADKKQVEDLYRTLDKQLKSLTKALESVNQTGNSAYRAVTSLSQNIDFLQQVNQAYTYIQLPLRLQQGKAHGDLYVYTNKKHLAMKDGQISALLHLDMEYLGPLDVYVAMTGEKVNTRFLVCDDEMLDFLMGHMEILTGRLQKRGYQCSFEMKVRRQEETAQSGIESLLQQEHAVPLSEFSFDVRT